MSLRLRLGLLLFIVIGCGFFFSIRSMLYDLRPHYLASMEEVLVETAEILAAQMSVFMTDGIADGATDNEALNTPFMMQTMSAVKLRELDAYIYKRHKTSIGLNVYMCNAEGIVVYTSSTETDRMVGDDYSQWNDVFLSLQGKYGARVTRIDIDDPASVMLYVAAPIYNKQHEICGTLTVSKSSDSVTVFEASAQKQIIVVTLLSALMIFFVILIMGIWITRPIKKLENYVHELTLNNAPKLPALSVPELNSVVAAIAEMRSALDGKQYIESYVQQLTHEFKSPLSVIAGASELLQGEMSAEQRAHFTENILNECTRMKELVDRILLLANIENQIITSSMGNLDLAATLAECLGILQIIGDERSIKLQSHGFDGDQILNIRADPFLLELALRNVILNAIEFSPDAADVDISCCLDQGFIVVSCIDNGPGVPDYAQARVFERFYSLPRPHSGRKSSGLGLSLVQAVMNLHHGRVEVASREDGESGTCVRMFFSDLSQ